MSTLYPTIIVEKFFSDEECKFLLDNIKNSGKEFDIVDYGGSDKGKSYFDVGRLPMQSYYDALNTFIEKNYNCSIISSRGKSVARYTKDQNINLHQDWDPNSPDVVQHNKPQVHISSISYLNEDFIGGKIKIAETVKNINKPNNEQRELVFEEIKNDLALMTITPKTGLTIFFDALNWHITEPIESGTKYCYTDFYSIEKVENS
jgi:hypothetical protein